MDKDNPYPIYKARQIASDIIRGILFIIIFPIFIYFFLTLAFGFSYPIIFIVVLFIILIVILGFAYEYIYLNFLKYSLDKEDFIFKGGFIARFEKILPYSKIQHIIISQSLMQRAFDIATISIQTARPEGYQNNQYNQNTNYNLDNPNIPGLLKDDAEKIKEIIISKVEKSKRSEKDI